MDDERRDDWLHESRQDRGEANDAAGVPIDLRDTTDNAAPSVGEGLANDASDVEMPEGGPYPLPEVQERPLPPAQPGVNPGEPTPDPSLSRAVDMAGAGLDPAAHGFDRTAEGPAPGPLGPDAEAEPPGDDDQPAGQWGSSGSA